MSAAHDDFVTTEDKQNEELAVFRYTQHLHRLGVTYAKYVATPDKCHWDYDVAIFGLPTIVLEVRSRKVTSTQVENWGNLLIDKTKLTALKEEFAEIDPISKKLVWDKHIVFVFLCVTDSVCYAITMDRLLSIWADVTEAPQDMMKRDHGEGQHHKKGWLIPVMHMEKF